MTGRTISHFRIFKELGSGGMGVVFEGEDLKLGRKVAIKFLRENPGGRNDLVERFEREARAASALNHPNICTVYEIDYFEGQPFLAMELLEGETLRSRMTREKIAIPDGLRITAEIADALDAAHRRGIIHRDIKPANIFITARGTGKVLDFGLAKSFSNSDLNRWSEADSMTLTAAADLTMPGMAMGTVAYMSPEQAQGEQVDGRSDLFSLGIVLYEMSAGQPPFQGSSPIGLLSAILRETPGLPSAFNPDVPAELDRIVKRALEKDRQLRYQTASDFRDDLRLLISRIESGAATAAGKFRPGRVVVLAAVVSLLTAAVLLGFFFLRKVPPRPSAEGKSAAAVSPIHTRRSIAVIGFSNLTAKPEVAWLSTALAEMLSTELAAGEQLLIFTGENVSRMKVELALPESASFSKDTLMRIKRSLGTDMVVLGSYADLGAASGGQLRVDLRLQDAATGETLASVVQTGTESNLFQLVASAGAQIRAKVGVAPISEAEGGRVRESMPSSPSVARLYSEGLSKLRVSDNLEARDLLEQVVKADPGYAPGHSALASAYASLGYDARSQSEAKEAFRLATNLAREDRLAIEGSYWASERNWDKAIGLYSSLRSLFPDNLEYGLRLARTQTQAGQGKQALTTLASLRLLAAPSRDDARIDLREADAYNSMGDFQKGLDCARAAAGKSEDAPLLRARARSKEGWSLDRLGRLQEAQVSLKDSQTLFDAVGDRQGTAESLRILGNILLEEGELRAARDTLGQALKIFRKIGDQEGAAATLNDLANELYDGDDFPPALALYRQSLLIYRETGSKDGIAGALGNIANVLDAQGELAEARKMQEQALAAFRDVADERGAASTLDNLGNLLFEQGELKASREAHEEALAQARKLGYTRGAAYSLEGLGLVLEAQGDLGGARAHFEQAMQQQKTIGQSAGVAATSLDLADLCMEEKNFKEAERLALAAEEEFAKEKAPESQALSALVVGRALSAQNNQPGAAAAMARARTLMPRTASPPAKLSLDLAMGRFQLASKKMAEARSLLQEVLRRAQKYGFKGYELEARLSLGEMAIRGGSANAVQQMRQLQTEAEQREFRLLASKAGAMLAGAGDGALGRK